MKLNSVDSSDATINRSIELKIEIETVTNCNLLQITVVSREDWFRFFCGCA